MCPPAKLSDEYILSIVSFLYEDIEFLKPLSLINRQFHRVVSPFLYDSNELQQHIVQPIVIQINVIF